MKKVRVIAVLVITFILLVSCDGFIKEENINRYIYPYLTFEVADNELSYTAKVIEGAKVKNLVIPTAVDYGSGYLPVMDFAGYKNPEDAKALESLVLGENVAIGTDAIKEASSLASITVSVTSENSYWYLPSTMKNKEDAHFIGWKAGDEFIDTGDLINPKNPVAVPVFEKHSYAIEHDKDYHWQECSVCDVIKGGKEAHSFENISGKSVCTYCGYEKSESSGDGGFNVGVLDKTPNGKLNYSESDKNIWKFTFVDLNKDYPPTTYKWFVNEEEQVGQTSPSFALISDRKQSYTVMCVFWNDNGIGSASVTVSGS